MSSPFDSVLGEPTPEEVAEVDIWQLESLEIVQALALELNGLGSKFSVREGDDAFVNIDAIRVVIQSHAINALGALVAGNPKMSEVYSRAGLMLNTIVEEAARQA